MKLESGDGHKWQLCCWDRLRPGRGKQNCQASSPSSSFAAGPGEPALDMVKVGGPVSVVKLRIGCDCFRTNLNIPCPLPTNYFSLPLIFSATHMAKLLYWLVVSPPLKNISQIGSSSQLLKKIKHVPNHQPRPKVCLQNLAS